MRYPICDKCGETLVEEKHKCIPLSSHAMLGEVAPLTKEKLLEKTLRAVLKRWKYDADQGDGIHETDYRLYNRAMKLIDPDYEPL